jgi:hypothetical protein
MLLKHKIKINILIMDNKSLQKAVDICDEIKNLLESLNKKKNIQEIETRPTLYINSTENIKINPNNPQNNRMEEERKNQSSKPAGILNNRQNMSHATWVHSLRSIGGYVRPNNY